MHNELLFIFIILISLILSGYNIKSYIKGNIQTSLLKKSFSPVETGLLVLLLAIIFFVSTLKSQTDAIFIATVIYLIPLIGINLKLFFNNKNKNHLYSSIMFLVIVILCSLLLIIEIL
jgi:hypothetical protein